MFFSATMPDEVMRFADTLAPNAVFVQVGSRRGPAQTISHEARILPAREKSSFLAKYLRRTHEPAIVFVNTKIGCNRLARQLIAAGLRAEAIHADRSQKDRTAAIESFRAGRTNILVATDVAARGLDIEAVGLIVNFDVPHGLDSYVHRVGRTGRNDAAGHALTLADPGRAPRPRADRARIWTEAAPGRLNGPAALHAASCPRPGTAAATGTRMHARTRELLDHLDTTRQSLKDAAAAVPVDRRYASADPARWSAAHIIEHLSIAERRGVVRLTDLVGTALKAGVPARNDDSIIDLRFAAAFLDRTHRFQAPDPLQPSGVSWESSWAALDQSRAEIRAIVSSTDGVELGDVSAPHPAFGQLTVYQLIILGGSHEARHAAQIRETRGRIRRARSTLRIPSPARRTRRPGQARDTRASADAPRSIVPASRA